MNVQIVCDTCTCFRVLCRYPYAFEIASTRHNGRVYLFASETNKEDRDQWMISLSHAIASLSQQQLLQINEVDKGGRVYIREGATGKYRNGWIHLVGHTLHVQNQVCVEYV